LSLSILKLPLALHSVIEPSDDSDTTPGDPVPYIFSPSAVQEINAIILIAADSCYVAASPTVLAWGIILQTLRTMVNTRREIRETRQSEYAAEGFSQEESSETEAGDSSATETGGVAPPRRTRSPARPALEAHKLHEDMLHTLLDSGMDQDPITFLARSAVDGSHVFDIITTLSTRFCSESTFVIGEEESNADGLKMRLVLLELVRASLEWVDYLPEVVVATLGILSGGKGFWELFAVNLSDPSANRLSPTNVFLDDEILTQRLLNVALSRFPYETLPLLRLFRALAACDLVDDEGNLAVTQMMRAMSSLTQALPLDFQGYELLQEETSSNTVYLTEDLPSFINARGYGRGRRVITHGSEFREDSDLSIPADTQGRNLTDSKPLVVMWSHQFSALKYLGRMLESALLGSDTILYALDAPPDTETIAEAIGLLAVMLVYTTKAAEKEGGIGTHEASQRILEEASEGVGHHRDVISIVFDIFEQQLRRQQTRNGAETSYDLLINCTQFICALLPILPGRVWPFLMRSGLLELDGRGGKLISTVAGTEMISGRYEFLTCCIRMFSLLVSEAVSGSVERRAVSAKQAKAVTRFRDESTTKQIGTGVSAKVMKEILLSFTRTMVDVFESLPTWKFVVLQERLEIGYSINTIFSTILRETMGVDDSPDLNEKITGVIGPSAEYLADVFLSSSDSDLPIRPLLQTLWDGVKTPDSSLFITTLKTWTLQVRSVLQFSTLLMQVGMYIKRPNSFLETQLFKAVPLLARLYAAQDSYRSDTIKLFQSLVNSVASTGGEEPPSLLGHLGSDNGKHFLSLLSQLGKPLDERLGIDIWGFLSAVVSQRQQWFAVYLLTGATPRNTFGKSTAVMKSHTGKPLLTVALDSLSVIDTLPIREAVTILEFVSMAQDYWSWAMTDLHKHPKAIQALSAWINNMDKNIKPDSRDKEEQTENCFYTKAASLVAEIFAMHLHHSRQMGGQKTDIHSDYAFFYRNAVSVGGYNRSLHGNLKRNFERKYPYCKLDSVKRTLLEHQNYGDDYFYDLTISGNVLDFEQAWLGSRGQGFRDEFLRANINLSLVDAQVVSVPHPSNFKILTLSVSAP
jgi:nuclear pore complex protein Nup188